MPIFEINGINVDFPKDAYPCQLDYMRSALQAMSNSTNALLESPTGTGKTLSLLCSTLAWQKHTRAASARVTHKLEYNPGPTVQGSTSSSSVQAVGPNKGIQKQKTSSCTIIYASRTHSQLAQVVEELQSSNYRPRMTVLGSRDQLCIHDKISKLKSGALNHACNSVNMQRGCSFKNNLEKYSPVTEGNAMAVMDIEEVKRVVGYTDRVCPYFYTRELSANADLVLLPYNYLLDNSIRATLKVDWQNSVIIFDEAHNLERVASDAASFTLTSTDLAGCIMELQSVLKSLHEKKENGGDVKDESDSTAADKMQLGAVAGGGGGTREQPSMQGTMRILKSLFALEKKIDQVPLNDSGPGSTPSNVLPGAWLCGVLEEVELLHTMATANIEEIRRCSGYLLEEAESSGAGGLAVPEPKLVGLCGALNRVFRGRNLPESVAAVIDYKVFVCEEEAQKKGTGSGSGSGFGPHGGKPAGVWVAGGTSGGQKKRVLNFWAFSPGIAMEDLKRLGVRTIILTSGTLSPMASFKEDMKLPFPIQLENKHVIENKQIWVGCLSLGSSGHQLNSTFKVRDTLEYKDEMGGSILNIIRTMAGQGGMGTIGAGVPPGPELKGGILVFFPSYGIMDSCVDRWRESGMLEKLRNVGGAVVVEPKGSGTAATNKPQPVKRGDRWSDRGEASVGSKGGFGFSSSKAPVMEGDEAGGGGAALGGVIKEFEATLASRGRCVLLAVCRGKASEGIDFRNNKGRVVIITGIPFAPYMDPWVILKKQYLDEKCLQKLPPKNPGNSSSGCSAAMGLEEAKRVYGSTGGFGGERVKPYAPYVPNKQNGSNSLLKSSYNAYDAANGHNLPASANLPHGQSSTYPPYPPAASATSTYGSNYTTYNQSTSTSTGGGGGGGQTHFLDGQGWYNQTASRAVNQAIGRVIRHKKDWGAIFLLDDRFRHDKQVAQLSSWVRPRLKKYPTFAPALLDFRKFLSAAMADPDLKIPVPVSLAIDSRPPGYVQAIAAIAAATAAASVAALNPQGASLRKISIKESDFNAGLGGGAGSGAGAGGDGGLDEISFINPDLLLTQHVEVEPVHRSTMSAARAHYSVNPSRSFGLANNAPSSSSISRSAHHGTNSSSNSSSSNSNSSSSNGSDACKPKTSSDMSDYLLKMGSRPTPTTSNARSSSSTTQSIRVTDSQTQPSAKNSQIKDPGLFTFSSTSSQGLMGAKSGMNVRMDSKEKNADFSQSQSTQLKAPVKKVINREKEEEVEKSKRSLLMASFSLVSEGKKIEKRTGEVSKSSRSSISSGSSSSSAIQQSAAPKAVLEKSVFGYNYSDTLSQVDQAGSDQASQPSKRAKMMLQAALQPAQAAVKRDIKGIFASLQASKMDRVGGGGGSVGGDKVKKVEEVSKRCVCLVCNCVAAEPCAAPCGHICCEGCWSNWLRVKETCPYCRAPTTLQKIKKIIITKN